MSFLRLSGIFLIAVISLCEEEVQAMDKPEKSEVTGNQPTPGDEWMLHTPGGGPLDSRCPCLPSDICPRPFGHFPTDVLILGHLPICKDESKVRCCGASFSVEIGPESAGANDTTKVEANSMVYINSAEKITSGMAEDSNIHTSSPPLEVYSDDDEDGTTYKMDIVESTEESPMTIDSLQNVRDSMVNENDTDSLMIMSQSFNQSENSDMVYIENLKPDVLLFQDTKGFIQDSKDGTIMVVTPIPLTPRAKYQQQLLSSGNMTSQSLQESNSSPIHTKDVPHVTHRPEGKVMVITPLSVEDRKLTAHVNLPLDEETGKNTHSPSQEERPQVQQDLKMGREMLGNVRNTETFTEGSAEVLSRQVPLEAVSVKHLSSVMNNENSGVIEETSLIGPGLTTESNTEASLKENHPPPMVLEGIQNNKSTQEDVRKEFGASQTLRNSKRPSKTRVVVRPTWSPKRIRTKQPEILDSRHFPRQGATLESDESTFQYENLLLSMTNKPLATRSTDAIMQDNNKNYNVFLQDSPSITSIKYVPVPMDKIDQLKLQAMLTYPTTGRIPNSLTDYQQTLMVGQTFPFQWEVEHNDDSRKLGTNGAIGEHFPKTGQDKRENSKEKQEINSLQRDLSAIRTTLRQWWVKNFSVAQPKRVKNENQSSDSSLLKIDLLQPSQQFYTHDSLYDYKHHDDTFGRKTVPNQ